MKVVFFSSFTFLFMHEKNLLKYEKKKVRLTNKYSYFVFLFYLKKGFFVHFALLIDKNVSSAHVIFKNFKSSPVFVLFQI